MGFKYTRSELAQLTGLSIETIKKRALKMGLKQCFKTINNKDIIAYELSEQDVEDLKHVLNFETPIEINEIPFKTHFKPPENTDNAGTTVDKLIEYARFNDERVERHIQRALNAENQLKMIETSEQKKDNEINRLNAELKQAHTKNEVLEKKLKELESKKWYEFFRQKKPD